MLPAVVNWFGGKTHLRTMILPHLSDGNLTYVEPYCGSANILLAKSPHPLEVLNDLNGDIVNFFRVLQNRRLFRHFAHRVRWTPYASDEFVEAIMCLNLEWDGKLSVERAWAFFVRGMFSFSGAGKMNTRGNWRRSTTGINVEANAVVTEHWRMRVSMLEAWRDRLLRVQIDHRPALAVIQYWDAPTSTFDLDPP
jgi:DNA adenine methylase